MKPCSPQPVPQEFLINQALFKLKPTNNTPWFTAVPQLLKTPLLYGDQFEASTATETGLPVTALVSAVTLGVSTKPRILKAPPCLAQAPSFAV